MATKLGSGALSVEGLLLTSRLSSQQLTTMTTMTRGARERGLQLVGRGRDAKRSAPLEGSGPKQGRFLLRGTRLMQGNSEMIVQEGSPPTAVKAGMGDHLS